MPRGSNQYGRARQVSPRLPTGATTGDAVAPGPSFDIISANRYQKKGSIALQTIRQGHGEDFDGGL